MDPSGIFATSYRADRRLVRTRWQALSLILFIAVLLAAPYLVGPRIVAILNIMYISAVVAVGLQICTGYAGQINLGQAAFMGVGAYTAAILAEKTGLTFLLTIPIAGFAAAVFGFLFGLTAARIKGFYLALTTIAAQFIFHFAVLNLPSSWLGGSNGVTVPPATLFGLRIVSEGAQYYLMLFVAAIMVAGAFGIVRSRFGRAFVAVRDDDVAAGIDKLFMVGEEMKALDEAVAGRLSASWHEDAAGVADDLMASMRAGDAIVVKGSRSIGLEKVVEALRGRFGAEAEEGPAKPEPNATETDENQESPSR